MTISCPWPIDEWTTGELLDYFVPGLIAGILVCVVAYLGFRLWLWSRRRQRHTIHIPGEHGDVYLSERAVRDIVAISLKPFKKIAVRQVAIAAVGKAGYRIRVNIELAPNTPFRVEQERMQLKIRSDLRDMIGVQAEIRPEFRVVGAAVKNKAGEGAESEPVDDPEDQVY